MRRLDQRGKGLAREERAEEEGGGGGLLQTSFNVGNMSNLGSKTSFKIKNKEIYLTEEEITDITSLLTYCKNYHPSSFLRKSAKRILEKFYNQNIFSSILKNSS